MRVLFDNGTPRGVASALTNHTVEEARAHGWDTLRNGESTALILHQGGLDQRARKRCDVPALRSFLHGDGYPVGKEQRARRREREAQFTRALRLFRGSRRIFFEAGFALNIIFSLVKGLMP